MTLGLPGDLARATLSRALARAGHAAAFVALGIGVLIALLTALFVVWNTCEFMTSVVSANTIPVPATR